MFDVRCSMFDVRCSMFDVRCSMFDVRCSMFAVWLAAFRASLSRRHPAPRHFPLPLPSPIPDPRSPIPDPRSPIPRSFFIELPPNTQQTPYVFAGRSPLLDLQPVFLDPSHFHPFAARIKVANQGRQRAPPPPRVVPPKLAAPFLPLTAPRLTVALLALALTATEAAAFWWMHPAPAGLDQSVLTYYPAVVHPVSDPAAGLPELPPVTSTLTALPEIVARSTPSLRCSTGTAARIDRDDGVTIHLAFFEWNAEDSTNVLEAFRHLPEECMGSIGMTLVEKFPPRTARVGDTLLHFDHTLFRDPQGVPIHAFKSVWVSGAASLIGPEFRGGADQWRQIHWLAALHRFRPAYARVTQGAVRRIASPDAAWQAFQSAVLPSLEMKSRPAS
jgi:hypothetical protein